MERNGLSGERWNERYDFLILYIIFLCFGCLVIIIYNFNDPPSTIPHAGYCLRADTVDGQIIPVSQNKLLLTSHQWINSMIEPAVTFILSG